jgi:translation initiation factor 3 subunit H
LYLQKLENDARAAKGEPPLPEEDLNKMFKPLAPPARLDSLLLAGQIATYSNCMTQFATQSFGKFFMADSLHPEGDEKPFM